MKENLERYSDGSAGATKVQGLGEEFYDLAKEWMQELKPTKGEEARQ